MSLPAHRKIELDQKCRIVRHRNFNLAQTDAPALPVWYLVAAVVVLCLLGVAR
jgi:hypothetical protein